MKLSFLGAAGTVTGSRTQVNIKDDLYWVDCGLFQGPKPIREQNWQALENIKQLKAVILTHAHIDHSGLLPLLVKQGFRGQILCSEATADLCRILLPDAGYLQEEDARFANMKKYSSHDPALPLYTQDDAIRCLGSLSPQKMNQWISLTDTFRFRLSRAGHILGSTFVEVGYEHFDGDRILAFSGDLGQPHPILLKEPAQIDECHELILESTYGDRRHGKPEHFSQLAAVINKVLGRGGTLIIPAFSVGRTQDLLYIIRRLEEQNSIGKHAVYLDSPMAMNATELYLKYTDEIKSEVFEDSLRAPLASDRFQTVRTPDESMLLCMDDSPKIVISAAGMLTGGRVLHHLKMKLPKEKNGVLFVGYQVPGSKGYLLKNGIPKIRLHHQEVDVEAEIFSLESLSAHADSNQIVDWVSKIRRKPQRIFLNHGEDASRQALAYRLVNELGIPCVLPVQKQEFDLDKAFSVATAT